MSRVPILCYLSISFLLAACAGVDVRDKDKNSLPGIPFRIKVPMWVHETKISKTQWLVQFTVDDDDPKTAAVPRKIPSDGPLLIECTSIGALRAKIDEIKAYTSDSANPDTVAQKIKEEGIAKLTSLAGGPANLCETVTSNILKNEFVVSEDQYYVTHIIPLFGSGSGAFKLAEDGTLTEATTTITDDTAKTLLGLLPIKEKLLVRWGAQATGAAAAGIAGVKRIPSVIEATITPVVTVYTLRDEMKNKPSGKIGLLSLSDALSGTGTVQLASTELVDDTPAPKPNPKAIKIQGTITPPGEEK